MMLRLKTIRLAVFFLCLGLVAACDNPAPQKKSLPPDTVSKRIENPFKQADPQEVKDKQPAKTAVAGTKDQPVAANAVDTAEKEVISEPVAEHYDASGKIDPFLPLIREKSIEQPVVKTELPKRILTPLEKIDLSQVRLVAVIAMKKKRIAMVEEASGKGYEVQIGTYIGKNQGRISEITDSSILVKEPVRDFRGRISERIQEIKLHKYNGEE